MGNRAVYCKDLCQAGWQLSRPPELPVGNPERFTQFSNQVLNGGRVKMDDPLTTSLGERMSPTETADGEFLQNHCQELLKRYTGLIAQQRMSWTTHLRLIRKLGEGGQGIVFLTERRGADGFTLPVALKIFSAERYRTPEDYDEDMLRMSAVASQVAQIQHDSLLQIQNFLDRDRVRMMVMEWVEGYDLRRLLSMRMFALAKERFSQKRWNHINQVLMTNGPEQPRFQPGVAVSIVRNCLEGLAALHRNSIVHADIKPANVMIKRTGQAKIIDLGSAFELGNRPVRRACTPAYASIEVLTGEFCTPRSDLASLGYLLVELLSGKSLFSSQQDLGSIIDGKRQILRNLPDQLPDSVLRNELLMAFIQGLVHPDPARRYVSADDAVTAEIGASAFLRQLVKGDMASEYDNDLRIWVDELLELDSDHSLPT